MRRTRSIRSARSTLTIQVYDARLHRWSRAFTLKADDAGDRECDRLRSSLRSNGYRTRVLLRSPEAPRGTPPVVLSIDKVRRQGRRRRLPVA